jgi:hypothetical protein
MHVRAYYKYVYAHRYKRIQKMSDLLFDDKHAGNAYPGGKQVSGRYAHAQA